MTMHRHQRTSRQPEVNMEEGFPLRKGPAVIEMNGILTTAEQTARSARRVLALVWQAAMTEDMGC